MFDMRHFMLMLMCLKCVSVAFHVDVPKMLNMAFHLMFLNYLIMAFHIDV